jgi:GT2 family glycosyltransferase
VSPSPALTFVIPVRDDADRLARCLDSIRAATGAHAIRVLVADNGSTDDTAARARSRGAEVISIPDRKVGAVRNEAARLAGDGVLAFVDSDHEIGRGWVDAAVDVMRGERVGAAGCACRTPPGATWVQRIYDALRDRPAGRRDVEWLGAGNLLVRGDVFASLGGFDASLDACEDVDLCNRLRAAGWRVVSDDRLENIHYGDPATLGRLFRSELWRGRDNLRVTLRGPWTLRALPSVAFPVANLAALALLLVSPLLAPSLGPVAVVAPVFVLTATIALRSLRILAAIERPAWLDPLRALAVGAAYELARALALLGRARHHRSARG